MVRRAVAEALGTALLLATIVGSGIMAERLAGGNVWLHRGPTSRGDGCYAFFRWLVPSVPQGASDIAVLRP